MNRKANVLADLLLDFGALILVVTALFYFYSFGDEVKIKDSDIRGLSLDASKASPLINNGLIQMTSKAISLSEKAQDFETSFKENLKNLAQVKREDKIYPDNNVFAKIVNLDYSLIDNGDKYVLDMKDNFYSVKSTDGLNTITKRFDLEIVFNKEKIISVEFK